MGVLPQVEGGARLTDSKFVAAHMALITTGIPHQTPYPAEQTQKHTWDVVTGVPAPNSATCRIQQNLRWHDSWNMGIATRSKPETCLSSVCSVCEDAAATTSDSADLLVCMGPCQRAFHASCLGGERPEPAELDHWYCPECAAGILRCCLCHAWGVGRMSKANYRGLMIVTNGDSRGMLKCIRCSVAFHKSCCPQGVRRYRNKDKIMLCPDCNATPPAEYEPPPKPEDAPSTAAAAGAGSAELSQTAKRRRGSSVVTVPVKRFGGGADVLRPGSLADDWIVTSASVKSDGTVFGRTLESVGSTPTALPPVVLPPVNSLAVHDTVAAATSWSAVQVGAASKAAPLTSPLVLPGHTGGGAAASGQALDVGSNGLQEHASVGSGISQPGKMDVNAGPISTTQDSNAEYRALLTELLTELMPCHGG
eukprot:gene9549-9713_t